MSRKLLFLTAEFPYCTGETFIENELPYLEEAFDEITLVSLSARSDQTRQVGQKTKVLRFPVQLTWKDKMKAFRWLLKPIVWNEIFRLVFVHKLFPIRPRMLTVLFSWERAHQLKHYIYPLVTEDTICYSYWTDDMSLALAQLKRKYPKIKMVSRFHGWDVYFEASTIHYLPFRWYVTQNLNLLFSISETGKRYAYNNWNVSASDKIQVARLGTKGGLEIGTRRIENPSVKVVVSCSNVIPLKRVERIFHVLNALEEVNIHWVHFGDGNILEAIKEQVKRHKREHLQVEWKGRVSNQDVLQFYARIQPWLFINLSTSEGIPVSIMEALSLGIPVLASAVGGTPEIVSNDVGALVPSQASIKEISQEVEKLLNLSLKDWNLLSANCFAFWQVNYNAEKNYSDFATLLTQE